MLLLKLILSDGRGCGSIRATEVRKKLRSQSWDERWETRRGANSIKRYVPFQRQIAPTHVGGYCFACKKNPWFRRILVCTSAAAEQKNGEYPSALLINSNAVKKKFIVSNPALCSVDLVGWHLSGIVGWQTQARARLPWPLSGIQEMVMIDVSWHSLSHTVLGVRVPLPVEMVVASCQ